MLALVGVAAAALGTGFLAQEEIMVNLQGLGVGSTVIQVPVSNVFVDLSVTALEFDSAGKSIFINIVNKCSFHYSSQDRLILANGLLGPGSVVICKISDEDGDIVAEGRILANNMGGAIAPSETHQIVIDKFAFPLSTKVGWVHDVEIVVLGTFNPPQPGN